MCRSVPHTPAECTRSSTSPGPGAGMSAWVSVRPWLGSVLRSACMAWGPLARWKLAMAAVSPYARGMSKTELVSEAYEASMFSKGEHLWNCAICAISSPWPSRATSAAPLASFSLPSRRCRPSSSSWRKRWAQPCSHACRAACGSRLRASPCWKTRAPFLRAPSRPRCAPANASKAARAWFAWAWFRRPCTRCCPAMAPSHPLAAGEGALPLQSAAHEPFVGFARYEDADYFDRTVALCLDAGFTPSIRHEAGQFVNVLALVACGLGVAIVPSSFASLYRGKLVFRPLQQSRYQSRLAVLAVAGSTDGESDAGRVAQAAALELKQFGRRLARLR